MEIKKKRKHTGPEQKANAINSEKKMNTCVKNTIDIRKRITFDKRKKERKKERN